MRSDIWKMIKKYRIMEGPLASTHKARNNGAFMIPCPNGTTLGLVVSDQMEWDHVSVSCENRIPTWQEMCFIKKLFFHPHEAVMQLHPPEDDYINNHPFVLHLWRPQNKSIPMPPKIMV